MSAPLASTPDLTALPGRDRPLRIVIVGHVDHGKSTLVGRLFHDTGSLPEGKLEAIEATCKRRGVPFEWAFLMDAFQSERDQNITIDTAQIWFSTQKRPYVIIDAPGHREFLKNMVTGAAQADAALLLIAADEGVQEQSRRHGLLLSLLGVKQVHVVINKMDRVGFDENIYRKTVEEYGAFLATLGVTARGFIPISARDGDNVASRSARSAFYDGPTVVEALDGFAAPLPPRDGPLRFPIQDVYRFDHRRILAGRIESGRLRVGDTLVFSPGERRARVASLETWSAAPRHEASAGDSVGITLDEQIFVERGHVASLATERPPASVERFTARLFWMGKKPLELGRPIKLKLATQEVSAHLVRIDRVLDAGTLQTRPDATAVVRDDVAEVEIATRAPLVIDEVGQVTSTGRFVVVDGYDVAGGGIIESVPEAALAEQADRVHVTPAERAARAGHTGGVVWLAGPGPRHELGQALVRRLFDRGVAAQLVDAVALARAASGFGAPQPLLLEVARLFADAGVVAVALPVEPVVPQAPQVDKFFDIRVGRLAREAPERALAVDPEGDGLAEVAERVIDHVLPQLKDQKEGWFYEI